MTDDALPEPPPLAEGADMPDGAEALLDLAEAVLRQAKRQKATIASAESCTGGLLSSLLTDIEGCSGLFERGFATYSAEAKAELLGVAPILIARHGAVSREVAIAMVQGALEHSRAELAVAITGFAGPAGDRDEEGLVHLAAASRRAVRLSCWAKCWRPTPRPSPVAAHRRPARVPSARLAPPRCGVRCRRLDRIGCLRGA